MEKLPVKEQIYNRGLILRIIKECFTMSELRMLVP